MAAPKPNATVCGIPTRIGGTIRYGGGNVYVNARDIGGYASISKPGAKRLMMALFGHARLPRPGYETKLCADQYLVNMSGSLQVNRRASGPIAGPSRKRRRRR